MKEKRVTKKILYVLLAFVLCFNITVVSGGSFAYASGDVNAKVSVSSGSAHSIVLKNDGTVWTWGDNDSGQLGDGTTEDKNTPVQVAGLTDVKAVAAGKDYNIVLKSDGTVWAWGRNYYGQLGDGTTEDRHNPVQVIGLTDVKAIIAGGEHSIALKSDGTVWVWGRNFYGQLGDGTTIDKHIPVQLNGLTDIKAVALGQSHSIALKSDGTVWAWGLNNSGQLGDSTTEVKHIPVQVTGLTDVEDIGSGNNHGIALKNDGSVWTWGNNMNGQLGDGTTEDKNTPIQVTGLTDVKAVAAGSNHSIVLKSDGTVWAWGYNNCGELGDNTTKNKYYPVQVTGLTDVKAVAAGSYHNIALKSDGTVWSWGNNPSGQLGDGTTERKLIPVQVKDLDLYPIPEVATPTNLTATASISEVNLSWNVVSDIDSYNVKRSTTSGGPYTTIESNITENTYTDNNVESGIIYYYVVTAIKDVQESENSNEASAEVIITAPTIDIQSIDKARVGDEIIANVEIHNVNNIYAEDIKLTIDTNIFEFVSAEAEEGLKIYHQSDEAGAYRFIVASLGEANAANDDKLLLKLKLKAKNIGEGKIDITNARIADNSTLEMNIEEQNCGEKTIIIEGYSDVNKSGEFTLLDLGIDAWYYGQPADSTDSTKYDADTIADGQIDDKDLNAIVAEILENDNYEFN